MFQQNRGGRVSNDISSKGHKAHLRIFANQFENIQQNVYVYRILELTKNLEMIYATVEYL